MCDGYRFAPPILRAEDERAETVARHGHQNVFVHNVRSSRSLKSGGEALSRILSQAPDMDAVFCNSDLLAITVMTEAIARGITIPGRLSIVGFGDVPYQADMVPSLTTVRINGGETSYLPTPCKIRRRNLIIAQS